MRPLEELKEPVTPTQARETFHETPPVVVFGCLAPNTARRFRHERDNIRSERLCYSGHYLPPPDLGLPQMILG